MKKRSRKIITLVLLAVFFIGLSVLLYPSISNFWNQKTQSKAVANYDKLMEKLKPEDFTKLFEQADKYNKELADLPFPLTQYKELDGYKETLNVDGTGMFGYISIDKIQVELPIYHSTDSSVLDVACGHLEGTSLPVGGKGTHCVLSAHRGLPTAKLFTNLDKLENGDTFRITVLDRVLTYEVDQIRIVTPREVKDLMIEDDKDYCTLLTCTPYGINSHRLLVRGHRVENRSDRNVSVVSEAYVIDRFIVTPIVALPILLVLILYVCFKPAKKKLPIMEGEDDYE